MLKDKLKPDTSLLLEGFLEVANIGNLHLLDEERWRRFVIQAHLDGTDLDDSDIADAIRERFPAAEEFALQMGDRFVNERDLLNQYDKAQDA